VTGSFVVTLLYEERVVVTAAGLPPLPLLLELAASLITTTWGISTLGFDFCTMVSEGAVTERSEAVEGFELTALLAGLL
jgi:hypothetical protein